MPPEHRYAAELSGAIQAANPFLRPVAVPKEPLIGTAVRAPDLFPDDAPTRGYYLPIPPPPPFKVDTNEDPTLVGEAAGRQWSVHVLANDPPSPSTTPTLGIRTFVRLLPEDRVPFSALPWTVAATESLQRPGLLSRGTNLPLMLSRTALARANRLLGRPPAPKPRPPVQNPVVLAAWSPAAQSYLESPKFLDAFARWERRASSGLPGGGAALPVVQVLGDQVSLYLGIGPGSPVAEHAKTVGEFVGLVSDLERTLTGLDATTDPIPTVTFTDPPGSVPDVRPGYLCPKCGQLEIVRTSGNPATKLRHLRTLRCGVDVYPPHPVG